MHRDSYAEARLEIGEILQRCAAVRDSELELLSHLGQRADQSESLEYAVAQRVVALLTKGIEDPRCTWKNQVIAPNNRVISVIAINAGRTGIQGGRCISVDNDEHDEVALVAFNQGVPTVVHIIDSEDFGAVVEHLGESRSSRPSLLAGSDCMSAMFHYSMMLDQTVSEVLGVRTFLLDQAGAAGWTRFSSL